MTNNEKHHSHTADLINECRIESIQLLKRNLTTQGILAATPTTHDTSDQELLIFCRDAALCAIGMVVSDDAHLQEGALHSLLALAAHQADNGQIPKCIAAEGKDADFWFVGCIDATLWWLVAIQLFEKHLPDAGIKRHLRTHINRALTWLRAQEHQRLYLLQQNEASDWADVMPRSGFVLYTNALWYLVKRLYNLPHCQETKFHFNHLFYPFSHRMPDYHRLRLLRHYARRDINHSNLYLSFVNFSYCGEEGDVFGNILAILCDLANENPTHRILHALEKNHIAAPYPVRATCVPIEREDILWRRYMALYQQQNLEYHYQNSGAWPFLGGFWVISLVFAGEHEQAIAVLHKLAEANHVGNWGFYEWFHGLTGHHNGRRGQSWNAALFLLALHSFKKRNFFI